MTTASFGPEKLSLTDRTNAGSSHEDQGQHKLRRSKSSQSLAYDFDSSEALSADHGSIFNAEPVSSTDDLTSLRTLPSTTTQHLPQVPSDITTLLSLSDFRPLESHILWPPAQLEPILERHSRSTLHSTNSLPRLRRSPERSSRVVKQKLSIHSIHPKHPSPISRDASPYHIRSFSLNDLDCFPRSDTKQAFTNSHDRSSSSSTEILRAIRRCYVFPWKPVAEAPYRAPTPPGLPSFRTREAQEYRLSPVTPPSRPMAFLNRWLRQNENEEEDRISITSILSSPVSSPLSLPTSQTNLPMDMLKRILGVPRVIPSPPQSRVPSRIPLPPGVRIENSPGILIQADDGTAVRGRWGHRTSGHGVGSRMLESHPFSRAAEPNSIPEIVREIDKACRAVGNGSQYVSFEPDIGSGTESCQLDLRHCRPLRYQAQVNTESALIYHPRTNTNPVRPQMERRRYENRTTASGIGPHRSDSQIPAVPHTMQEPYPYSSNPRPRTLGNDSIRALQEFIQQGEQEQMRRQADIRREKEDRCRHCWEAFWLRCCGVRQLN